MEAAQREQLQPSDAVLSQLDRHGYLFGQKITHSWSPYLHGLIYENLGLRWAQLRLDSSDMANFLRLVQHPNFYGMEIRFYTVPTSREDAG